MDNALWIGLLSALSALAGAAISQWGALRSTALRSRLETDRDTLQRQHESESRQAAVLAQKREEFLGFVLVAETRMSNHLEALLQGLPPVAAEGTAAAAARQAYAVALLYLDALSPLAKAFYQATAKCQQAMVAGNGAELAQLSSAWRKSFSSIEEVLAGTGQQQP